MEVLTDQCTTIDYSIVRRILVRMKEGRSWIDQITFDVRKPIENDMLRGDTNTHSDIAQLPESVRNNLPAYAKEIYMKALALERMVHTLNHKVIFQELVL